MSSLLGRPDNALCFVVPTNDAAKELLDYEENETHIAVHNGEQGFSIGYYMSDSNEVVTVATMGDCGDIVLPSDTFSETHCAFEINLNTGYLILHDRSPTRSYKVDDYPFENTRELRRVVIDLDFNRHFSMTGTDGTILQFRIDWPFGLAPEARKRYINHFTGCLSMFEPICLEAPPSAVLSSDEGAGASTDTTTRVSKPEMRYRILQRLGSGAFGVVSKVLDVDSGDFVALKTIHTTNADVARIARESDVLSKLDHVCAVYLQTLWMSCANSLTEDTIVRFIDSTFTPTTAYIFTDLADGDLNMLIDRYPAQREDIVFKMLPQVLSALDFLDTKGLIHRDVKQANILFRDCLGIYVFKLADFGLANWQDNAITRSGTKSHMAPEVYGGFTQTSKADVWSLFVTALELLDPEFTAPIWDPEHGIRGRWMAVEKAPMSKQHPLHAGRAMARQDPAQRASAAQILSEVCRGKGLTTDQSSLAKIKYPEA